MGEAEVRRVGIPKSKYNGTHKAFDPSFLVQLPNKLQDCIKSQLKNLLKDGKGENLVRKEKGSSAPAAAPALGIDLERQLHAWRENPAWTDQPPQIKVSVPRGSLCNLNAKVDIGLPPDAVYDIVSDPDNRRVFKNIKEVVSRRVLLDEGHRQVVDVEQAAIWKFLWWSGTISVHVLVDQNRQDHSVRINIFLSTVSIAAISNQKLVFNPSGEDLFVLFMACYLCGNAFRLGEFDELHASENWVHEKIRRLLERGKGRIGSKVSLEQLIQPAIVPPPPISWYLRGITTRTTEMIVNDLVAEAGRIRVGFDAEKCEDWSLYDEKQPIKSSNIKERWALHRRNAKKRPRKFLTAQRSSFGSIVSPPITLLRNMQSAIYLLEEGRAFINLLDARAYWCANFPATDKVEPCQFKGCTTRYETTACVQSSGELVGVIPRNPQMPQRL
ncbi:hypothetical protein POTOM_060901 [Populus tomentosa]|uniref:Uncharacterized protein n=1 Tax=Populus tomentosa TaxID=118781 RepID=A0A8X7XU08_POPTO|nr:hypothetical protein POTOM_060901 [Populus tomentosa]